MWVNFYQTSGLSSLLTFLFKCFIILTRFLVLLAHNQSFISFPFFRLGIPSPCLSFRVPHPHTPLLFSVCWDVLFLPLYVLCPWGYLFLLFPVLRMWLLLCVFGPFLVHLSWFYISFLSSPTVSGHRGVEERPLGRHLAVVQQGVWSWVMVGDRETRSFKSGQFWKQQWSEASTCLFLALENMLSSHFHGSVNQVHLWLWAGTWRSTSGKATKHWDQSHGHRKMDASDQCGRKHCSQFSSYQSLAKLHFQNKCFEGRLIWGAWGDPLHLFSGYQLIARTLLLAV